jgi:hypothetical protein
MIYEMGDPAGLALKFNVTLETIVLENLTNVLVLPLPGPARICRGMFGMEVTAVMVLGPDRNSCDIDNHQPTEHH